MEKIPTAEEVMQKHLDPHDCLRVSKCYEMTLDAMKEFAKIHVEAALKSACSTLPYDDKMNQNILDIIAINKSYPVENIK